MNPADDKRRPRGPTWHNRHAGTARESAAPTFGDDPTPTDGVVRVLIEEDQTGPIDLAEISHAPTALAVRKLERHSARHRKLFEEIGKRLDEHTRTLDERASVVANAAECAKGAGIARRALLAMTAVAVLVPSAGFGAARAFITARDSASTYAAKATAEREALRLETTTLRAELAALVRTFAPPQGSKP